MSELAPINERDVSLFRLKSELVELMQLRENEELSIEERDAINCQIKAYISAELRKVDNVASFIRHRRVMAKVANDEAHRLARLAASYEAEEEYVLGMCKDLMIQFGEKKLEGERGSISLQKNGGLQSIEIFPNLVPDELCDWVGRIEGPAWLEIQKCCDNENWQVEADPEVKMQRVHNGDRIREALKQGPVAGARLQERGEHVRIR